VGPGTSCWGEAGEIVYHQYTEEVPPEIEKEYQEPKPKIINTVRLPGRETNAKKEQMSKRIINLMYCSPQA
jgi:hypothetical protein